MKPRRASIQLFAILMLGQVLATSARARAEMLWFVDNDAAGANDGSSWADAFVDLQGALSAAVAGDEIWVAAGIYTPTLETEPGNPRTVTFALPTGVSLYGGFAGTETSREQRDFQGNTTILSGDLSGDDGPEFANSEENAYHVVVSFENDDATVLDGFTVRGGRADGTFNEHPPNSHNQGSAVTIFQGQPRLANCTFERNWAASVGAVSDRSGVQIADCTFRNNYADGGAGLWIGYVDTEVIRCRFEDNTANTRGGGIYQASGTAVIRDCEFTGNASLYEGGGVFCIAGRTDVFDCTFDSNTAVHRGGGLYSNNNVMALSDSTFTGNVAERGGGLTLYGGIVSRCRVIGNIAEEGGGLEARGALTVNNSLFSGNTATNRGGGVYSAIGALTLASCTIAGNSSGIHAGSGVTITNSIVWGNGASGLQDQAAQFDSFYFVPVVNHTCMQGSTAGVGGTGNTNQDPLFVDAGNWDGTVWFDGDYRLTADSPVIDAGDNASSRRLGAIDLDGFPRIVGQMGTADSGQAQAPIVDLGAYEYIADCNANGLDDGMDIQTGVSTDCGGNGIPDECEDCNGSGLEDGCDIDLGTSLDCDVNGVPDDCDLLDHGSRDCNFNGIPDRCDIASATSLDCDLNGLPDECDIALGNDCDGNGVIDRCEWDGYVGTLSFPGTTTFDYPEVDNFLIADVAFDVEDNLLLLGEFRGTIDLDPTAGVDERTSIGRSVFITKLHAGGSYAWTATFKSIGDVEPWPYAGAITSDLEGNVFVTGEFSDTVDFDPTPGQDLRTAIGDSDIFVVGLTSNGEYLWTATLGGTEGEYTRGVAVDPQGDVFASGAFDGTVDFDPTAGVDRRTSNGKQDVFITKLGADGSYRWTAVFGGTRRERPGGLTSDADGSVIFTGSFGLTVDFDPTAGVDNRTAPEWVDYLFVTKLNGDGSYGWTTTVGGLYQVYGKSVAVDSLGNVLVGGSFAGSADFDPGESEDWRTPPSSQDAFVLKLGADGSSAWAMTFEGPGPIGFGAISLDPQDNVLLVGSFGGTVDFDPTPAVALGSVYGYGAFISKYDSDGLYAWTATVETSTSEWNQSSAQAIDVDSQGTAALAGIFYKTVDFDPGSGIDERSTETNSAFVTRFTAPPGRCCQAVYGDLDGTGAVDLADILCVLDGFTGEFGNCPAERADVAPCERDGVTDLSDILAVLNAFAGDALCNPCDVP